MDLDEFLDAFSMLRFAEVEFSLTGTDRWYRVPHLPLRRAVVKHRCFDIVHIRPGKYAHDPVTAVAANMCEREFCHWLAAAKALHMDYTMATRIFKASIQYGYGYDTRLRRTLLDVCDLTE